MKDEGYEVEHEGWLVTLFSAPNYCDQASLRLRANAQSTCCLKQTMLNTGAFAPPGQRCLFECTQMGNKGAFIRFTTPDMTPQFTTFAASPHPDVRPMAYAAGMFGRLLGM